jgi:hypothetical protein
MYIPGLRVTTYKLENNKKLSTEGRAIINTKIDDKYAFHQWGLQLVK